MEEERERETRPGCPAAPGAGSGTTKGFPGQETQSLCSGTRTVERKKRRKVSGRQEKRKKVRGQERKKKKTKTVDREAQG